jgi:hypothetical protein
MTEIASTIQRAGRRVWVPSEPLRALGFDDIDIGPVNGDIEVLQRSGPRSIRRGGPRLASSPGMQAA